MTIERLFITSLICPMFVELMLLHEKIKIYIPLIGVTLLYDISALICLGGSQVDPEHSGDFQGAFSKPSHPAVTWLSLS